MKLKLSILLVIGLIVGLFSTVIPFSDYFSEKVEDIIYFRGILVAGLLINIFGAVNMRGFYQNILISLGSAVFALIIMSSYNLICDFCINTFNYYKWTFIIAGAVLLILSFLEAWSRLFRHTS